MKRLLVAIGVIAVALSFTSCNWTPFNNLPQFILSDESVKYVDGWYHDPQVISITVSYDTVDENDEISKVVLADGPLVDGELQFKRKVIEPTEVKISVRYRDDEDVGETTAFIVPNTTGKFIFVNGFDYVILKGTDHRSIDENRRFSIMGNLSEIEGFEPSFLYEPGLVQVSVLAKPSSLDQSGKTIEFGPVVLDEGEFSIEGDLDVPTLVTVKIFERPSLFRKSVEYLPAILEPGVNYKVVPLGNNGKWAVQADRDGLHTRLVSSWQLDPEYVSLVDRWMDDKAEGRSERKGRLVHEKEFVTNYPLAEECDHLRLSNQIKLQFADPAPNSRQAIGSEIVKWRSTVLRKILRDTQDLDLARMIYELSWIQFEEDEIVSAYDIDEMNALLLELALKMDQEFVDQYISPLADHLKYYGEMELTNRTLIPGQVAPEFALTTIAGDEVSLGEVVEENKLVLIDFWASWCGPCIRSFPALKKLYSKYKDQGFEIVTVTVDDSFEEWEIASEEQELPWIDLGDTENDERKSSFIPTADDYGVRWIPNKFLIDGKGCIVHKHFSDEDLEKMLSIL